MERECWQERERERERFMRVAAIPPVGIRKSTFQLTRAAKLFKKKRRRKKLCFFATKKKKNFVKQREVSFQVQASGTTFFTLVPFENVVLSSLIFS